MKRKIIVGLVILGIVLAGYNISNQDITKEEIIITCKEDINSLEWLQEINYFTIDTTQNNIKVVCMNNTDMLIQGNKISCIKK